ncbi:hypothetical protein BgiBS90_017947, partial [Biomphalaria glabrata]
LTNSSLDLKHPKVSKRRNLDKDLENSSNNFPRYGALGTKGGGKGALGTKGGGKGALGTKGGGKGALGTKGG